MDGALTLSGRLARLAVAQGLQAGSCSSVLRAAERLEQRVVPAPEPAPAQSREDRLCRPGEARHP